MDFSKQIKTSKSDEYYTPAYAVKIYIDIIIINCYNLIKGVNIQQVRYTGINNTFIFLKGG